DGRIVIAGAQLFFRFRVQSSQTRLFPGGFRAFRTVFVSAQCCARFLALANNTSAEVNAYMGRLPEGVSFMGYYAYGEYCPMKGMKTGKEYNNFHNFTFTLLII
ncbi:MAG: hypothetical protein II156_05280, partial [Lachnospiraceae bacterium]|nr:hypothetical protein [Lachnospiraceae bacterium]